VLVVVTVLGIAAALVVPSLSGADVLRVQGAVRTVVSDITLAQSEALAFQVGRAIRFDVTGNRYQMIEVRGTNIDASTDLISETFLGGAKFGDAEIKSATFAGDDEVTLIFDEMGGPVTAAGGSTPAGNGVLSIRGSGQVFNLTVEGYTGRVTVARFDDIPE
jgi:type II secretory pathway pseudopilin PulG